MTRKTQLKTDTMQQKQNSKSSSRREVYSNTILPQETRKARNRQPNFIPKTTGKRRGKKNPNQQKERKLQRSEQKEMKKI